MIQKLQTTKFVILTLFLVAGIVFGGYFVSKIAQEIRAKREAIDRVEAQEAIAVEKNGQSEFLARQYVYVRDRSEALQSVFVDKNNLVATIEKIESLADRSGVSVTLDIVEGSVKKQKPKTTPVKGASEATVDEQEKNKIVFLLETRGTYEKTVDFLEALERMRPVASFQVLNMKTDVPERSNSSVPATTPEETPPQSDNPTIASSITLSFVSFEGLW